MNQNRCVCMHRLAPGGAGLPAQAAFVQLGVSCLGSSQGRLKAVPNPLPCFSLLLSPHAVSHLNCGQLAAPAFCSSLLVSWVNVAFEVDKTVHSLSPGMKSPCMQRLLYFT